MREMVARRGQELAPNLLGLAVHGSDVGPPPPGQVERTSSRANRSGSEIAPIVVTSHTTTVVHPGPRLTAQQGPCHQRQITVLHSLIELALPRGPGRQESSIRCCVLRWFGR